MLMIGIRSRRPPLALHLTFLLAFAPFLAKAKDVHIDQRSGNTSGESREASPDPSGFRSLDWNAVAAGDNHPFGWDFVMEKHWFRASSPGRKILGEADSACRDKYQDLPSLAQLKTIANSLVQGGIKSGCVWSSSLSLDPKKPIAVLEFSRKHPEGIEAAVGPWSKCYTVCRTQTFPRSDCLAKWYDFAAGPELGYTAKYYVIKYPESLTVNEASGPRVIVSGGTIGLSLGDSYAPPLAGLGLTPSTAMKFAEQAIAKTQTNRQCDSVTQLRSAFTYALLPKARGGLGLSKAQAIRYALDTYPQVGTGYRHSLNDVPGVKERFTRNGTLYTYPLDAPPPQKERSYANGRF